MLSIKQEEELKMEKISSSEEEGNDELSFFPKAPSLNSLNAHSLKS